jgi:TPR repeat protein
MPQAQYLLGLCLMSGYGGEVDETKAMVWLKAASAAGYFKFKIRNPKLGTMNQHSVLHETLNLSH